MIEEHMVKSNINTIYNKHHITYQHVHVAGHRNINIYHFKDNFQGENDFEQKYVLNYNKHLTK